MSVSTAPTFEPAVASGVGTADGKTRAGQAGFTVASRVGLRAWSIVGLTTILVVAGVLRFHGLDREGFWGDEYAQVQLYSLPLHYTCWFALTKHAFGPLDFVIGWLVYRLDPSVWMCRLPSAIWGVVGVAACFFLVRRLASWREGLIAAALLALCRMHLVLSQEARPYSICLAFMLLTLLLLLRAFERPTYRRVVLYGCVAFFCMITRSFIPCVFVAVIGLVLSVALLARPRSSDRGPVSETGDVGVGMAIRRVWTVTLLAGLAALPMALFLFSLSTYTPGSSTFMPNAYGIDTRLPVKLATNAGIACEALFASYGPWVLGLAVAGVLMSIRRRRLLTPATQYVLAIMLGVGPAVVIVYSLIGGVHYFYERYSFFLIPVVAAFAAVAVVPMLRWLWQSLAAPPASPLGKGGKRGVLKWTAVCLCLAITLAYPAVMCADEMRSYRRRDWRGCARYLADMVSPDDVIMVLTDQPFGRVQHRFFGKYEWPGEHRPLAEAMWTLAVSDSHFKRLSRQAGRCYTVIAYPVEPQTGDAYRLHGLQAAPDGYRLVKFRGLDLLIHEDWSGDLAREVITTCDDLLSLPHSDPSTNVIPLILKSRTQLHLGLVDKAERVYLQAAALVPETQVEYFNQATAGWSPQAKSE